MRKATRQGKGCKRSQPGDQTADPRTWRGDQAARTAEEQLEAIPTAAGRTATGAAATVNHNAKRSARIRPGKQIRSTQQDLLVAQPDRRAPFLWHFELDGAGHPNAQQAPTKRTGRAAGDREDRRREELADQRALKAELFEQSAKPERTVELQRVYALEQHLPVQHAADEQLEYKATSYRSFGGPDEHDQAAEGDERAGLSEERP